MDDSVLDAGEREFLAALTELGVPFLVIGMSAALLEGATGSTQYIDLWFDSISDPRIAEAARRAREYEIDGQRVRVLPLERIIASKQASGRPKDRAVLPLLEEALGARESEEG